MDQDEQVKLREIATAIREEIEQYREEQEYIPIELASFPRGCCGFTAVVIVDLLRMCGWSECKYVTATDAEGKSHAWAQVDDVIVDITIDQFETSEPVYVGDETAIHKRYAARTVNENYGVADISLSSFYEVKMRCMSRLGF